MSREGEFLKGLVLGAVIGATAGILLAPQSGEETREDIKKLSEEILDKAQTLYATSKKKLQKKVKDLKAAGKKIDFEVYKKLVANVVDEIKKDKDVAEDTAKRIGKQLQNDWEEIRDAIV
ncbi:YtxH domain-containing protein [Candidatus Dojkabacteria bacterium]|uniref:YtxH domain-containing protein n=1 Tax=Candidatus Dojkabacteria bacterium TaxID=2099670 RepID=A0A847VD58_9BACT|nr:YtxH domain-containing protein [Candidatus Dojkabacteria bacterium]